MSSLDAGSESPSLPDPSGRFHLGEPGAHPQCQHCFSLCPGDTPCQLQLPPTAGETWESAWAVCGGPRGPSRVQATHIFSSSCWMVRYAQSLSMKLWKMYLGLWNSFSCSATLDSVWKVMFCMCWKEGPSPGRRSEGLAEADTAGPEPGAQVRPTLPEKGK